MEAFEKELREAFATEIAKTRKKIIAYEEMTQPVSPDNAIGRISRMDSIVNSSVTESVLREARQKLENLEAMLGQIGEPGFGCCRKCGAPIPVKRMLLMPQSPYCVAHAR